MGRNDHIAAAKECLSELRSGSVRARALIVHMRDHALEAGLSLRDLGTNVEELDELLKDSIKIRAIKILTELREDGRDVDHVQLIRESVNEANCSLEDIGTSENELTSFEASPVNLFE